MIETLESRVADLEREGNHYRTFIHEDGTVSVVMHDYDYDSANPRDMDNATVLVQGCDRYLKVDDDEADLTAVIEHYEDYDLTRLPDYMHEGWLWSRQRLAYHSRHDADDMVARYLRIFRPEVLAWGQWSHRDGGYGIAYVLEDNVCGTPPEHAQEVLDQDLRSWYQYLNGESLYVVALTPTGPIVVTDVEGETVLGEAFEEDSCYGFLGWDYAEEFALDMASGSPIIESRW